jgi:hypothetical protein
MIQTFETELEFASAIDATLQNHVTSVEIRNALTAGIGTGEQDSRDDPPNSDGALNLRLNSWILREQDIPFTELIGVVGAAVAAALLPGGITAAAVLTALSAFAGLAWKAWRKGAKLSKIEVAVLGFLEMQGPMSLEDLKVNAPLALKDISKTDVERALQSLQDVELRDGNIVELIRKDASGLWRTQPI